MANSESELNEGSFHSQLPICDPFKPSRIPFPNISIPQTLAMNNKREDLPDYKRETAILRTATVFSQGTCSK